MIAREVMKFVKSPSLVSSNKTFGVEVQPANRIKPAKRGRQKLGNSRPTFGIGNTGKITLWFIQQHVDLFATLEMRVDEFAANLDVIFVRIGLSSEFR